MQLTRMKKLSAGLAVGAALVVVAVVAGVGGFEGTTTEASLFPCRGIPPTIAGTDRCRGDLGHPCHDVIDGKGGDDIIYGLGGDDLLCGGEGNDLIRGGLGKDEIHGGPGSDRLLGGFRCGKLWGGAGNDYLFGQGGRDRLVVQHPSNEG